MDKFDAIYCLHQFGIDSINREIYISGESDSTDEVGMEPGVEYLMADKFIKNLKFLTNESHEGITIHMKTCGGDWTEGIAMYDAIKNCPAHVTIISYTHARSMSSIILQAADNRVLMPHSYFMFHKGSYSVSGDYKAVQSQVQFDLRDDKAMMDIYTDSIEKSKTAMWEGLTRGEVIARLEQHMNVRGDVFLTPEEAVEWGFADKVLYGFE